MLKLQIFIKTYLLSEKGATAIEYGLMATAIALAILALVFSIGDRMEGGYQVISDTIDTRL